MLSNTNFENFKPYENYAIHQVKNENSENKVIDTKTKPHPNDEFVNSKKVNTKKTLKIIGITALAALATVGIVKGVKINSLKKEATRIFNESFDEIAQSAKKMYGFDMVKPELKFSSIFLPGKDKGQKYFGFYSRYSNSITLNTRLLHRKNFITLKDGEKAFTRKISNKDNSNSITISFFNYVPSSFKKKLKNILGLDKKTRVLTQKEIELKIKSAIQHELTHSKQNQFLLNSEGGKEAIVKAIKNSKPQYANLNEADIMAELNKTPFISGFKPNKMIGEHVYYRTNIAKDGKFLAASKETLADAMYGNYTNTDRYLYTINLVELDANAAEIQVYSNFIKNAKENDPAIPFAKRQLAEFETNLRKIMESGYKQTNTQ